MSYSRLVRFPVADLSYALLGAAFQFRQLKGIRAFLCHLSPTSTVKFLFVTGEKFLTPSVLPHCRLALLAAESKCELEF